MVAVGAGVGVVEGKIHTITFKNEDNGYSILKIVGGGKVHTATGTMPEAAVGLQAKFTGEWKKHPRFGDQLNFNQYEIIKPSDREGIVAYLCTLKGVGPSMANKIYNKFEGNTLKVLDTDIQRLKEVKGISEKVLEGIILTYQNTKELRNLISFLGTIGVSTTYASKIYKEYGSTAVAKIKANPYLLADQVKGFGFKKADEVALKLGIKPDSEVRYTAGIMFTLKQAAMDGHVYLPVTQLLPGAGDILALPVHRPMRAAIEAVMKLMIAAGTLIEDQGNIYQARLHKAEVELADAIKRLAGAIGNGLTNDLDTWIAKYEFTSGITLAPQQREAVEVFSKNGFMVMTGGAGVGKLQPLDEPVLTPTGWKRMGDIKQGDYVISKEGLPTQVLATFPGSDLEIYRVNFDDGTWAECCIDHLWQVQTPKQRERGTYSVRALKDMLDKISSPKIDSRKRADGGDRVKQHYFSVDLCQPVQFEKQELEIHPYLLGWLLGDGYIPDNVRSQPCIATWVEDSEEIAARLNQYLPSGVKSALYEPSPFTPSVKRYSLSRSLTPYVQRLGLAGKKSRDKFIPRQYLFSDITDRKFLLAGLLDTDGSVQRVNDKNSKASFSSTSLSLATGVVELVQSLGGRATLKAYDRPDKGLEYDVSIRLPFNPFILHRKQAAYGNTTQFHKFRKRIVSAEYVGKKNGQCLLVDNPDHLYLTRHYTVTHNTSTAKAIVQLAIDRSLTIVAAAPTGKAAQRLKESTGLDASTIHRLLGAGSAEGYGSVTTLDGDLFLIDEASMIDVSLAALLFKAIPSNARVVVIGDPHQLPSVSAGRVLADLIECGTIPVVKLTQVFRQAAQSHIIQAGYTVNDGRKPLLEQIDRGVFPTTDAWWVRCETEQIPEKIEWLVRQLPLLGWSKEDVQCLCPMNKGDYGNLKMNELLQGLYNPPSPDKPELRKFRLGDRVIQTKNDYNRNVFNGDIGEVIEVDLQEKLLRVRFASDDPQGKVAIVQDTDFDDLNHAYSLSIHKSQGSEFPVVILPMTTSHYVMLQRNLLYTGITRAKKLLILVGQDRAVEIAARTIKSNKRFSGLIERLK